MEFYGKTTQHIEDKIDLMVYKLYELNYEEVKIVDPSFVLSREEYENFRSFKNFGSLIKQKERSLNK